MKLYDAQKAKGLFLKLKYHTISGIDLKMRCFDSKWSNVKICKETKWKASLYVIIFLWEVIYVHFYNWDRPFDLVLVVYDLIELIIEALL